MYSCERLSQNPSLVSGKAIGKEPPHWGKVWIHLRDCPAMFGTSPSVCSAFPTLRCGLIALTRWIWATYILRLGLGINGPNVSTR